MPKRRHFTASQKAQIVLEALKEDKAISQIAAENQLHPNQIHHWKKQACLEKSTSPQLKNRRCQPDINPTEDAMALC